MATKTQPTSGLYGANLAEYIAGRSRQLHLDPAAVLAVISTEGGFHGAVGDQGTSFGPFQLHQGGALPSGMTATQARTWANSPAGIDFGLSRVASVAAGESSGNAITDIVTKFERPTDPTAEISRAENAYPSFAVETSRANFASFGSIIKAIVTAPAQVFQGTTGHNVKASPTGPNSVVGQAGASIKALTGFDFLQIVTMLAGGVLILLGLIIIVIGGKGTPSAQTTRALRTVTA